MRCAPRTPTTGRGRPPGSTGHGGQIHAGQYHVLKGSDGKTPSLIETEQEGASQTVFALHGARHAAGVTLTVTGPGNVTSNRIDWSCLGAGARADTGTVTGTVFRDTTCDGFNGIVQTVPGKTVTIEAESMEDREFRTVAGAQAPGGKRVRRECGDWQAPDRLQGRRRHL